MSELIKYLEGEQEGVPPRVKRDDSFNYTMIDTVLCKLTTQGAYHGHVGPTRPLMVIPPSLRPTLISETHAGSFESHGGIQETFDKLKSMVVWPGMYADVVEYVRTCVACQAAKHQRHAVHSPRGRIRTGYGPMDALSVDHADLIGNETALGNRHILVVVCLFTRYLWCIAVKDKSATTTAYVLNDFIFMQHGAPRLLVSDRGTAFISKVSSCLYDMHNIVQRQHIGRKPMQSWRELIAW